MEKERKKNSEEDIMDRKRKVFAYVMMSIMMLIYYLIIKFL